MDKILIMQVNDIWWGIPFLIILFFAVKQFIDSIFAIYVKSDSVDRQHLLDSIRAGDIQKTKELVSSKDPLVGAIAPIVASSMTDGCISEKVQYNNLKKGVKLKVCELLKIKQPHKALLNYYSVTIMLLGYLGNIIANFLMFSKFGGDSSSNTFLEHFQSMAIGLKACFFGVVGAIVLPLLNIYLKELIKKRKCIIEDFYSAIAHAMESISGQGRVME